MSTAPKNLDTVRVVLFKIKVVAACLKQKKTLKKKQEGVECIQILF